MSPTSPRRPPTAAPPISASPATLHCPPTSRCGATPGDAIQPLVVGDDGTLYATFQAAIVAIEPVDGRFRWTAPLPARGVGVALALDGTVVAVSAAHVLALAPRDGRVTWSSARNA